MTSNPKLEAEICYNHGNVLASQGNWKEALDSYDLAIKLDLSNPTYYNNRAGTLKRLGRVQEAIQQYGRIIANFPSYGKAYLSIASTAVELNDSVFAVLCYEKFIVAYKHQDFVYHNFWGGIDRSQAMYGKSDLWVIFLSSINYLKKLEKIQAIKDFQTALSSVIFMGYLAQSYLATSIDVSIEIGLEAIAINNAVIATNYENNSEINSFKVKLLEEEVNNTKHCSHWYLEINDNQGDAASYSLDIIIYTDSNYNYPLITVTCGLKTICPISDKLENLGIYSSCVEPDSQPISFWTLSSLFEEEQGNHYMTKRLYEEFIQPASKTEPIIQSTEMFSTFLLQSLMS
jgi:tetratricopeptide (TPR) repeat protein